MQEGGLIIVVGRCEDFVMEISMKCVRGICRCPFHDWVSFCMRIDRRKVCCSLKACVLTNNNGGGRHGAGERKSDEKRILTDGEQNRLSTDCPPTHILFLSFHFLLLGGSLSAWVEWLTHHCKIYVRMKPCLFRAVVVFLFLPSLFVCLGSISLWRTL